MSPQRTRPQARRGFPCGRHSGLWGGPRRGGQNRGISGSSAKDGERVGVAGRQEVEQRDEAAVTGRGQGSERKHWACGQLSGGPGGQHSGHSPGTRKAVWRLRTPGLRLVP